MVWLALEPLVPDNSAKALALAAKAKLPRLQEFVPRRMLAGKGPVRPPQKRKVSKADWQKFVQQAAPGFSINDSGEGGVIRFGTFRNKPATDSSDQAGEPSALGRKLEVPKGKKTVLRAVVSHHSHGDWELRVKVDGKIISKAEVSSKTTTDEWLTHQVDLTPYGQDRRSSTREQPDRLDERMGLLA